MKSDHSDTPIAFEGRLTSQSAETGIQSLQTNAARLARDARLLFHAKRYPSAALLAATALDEVAKIPVLMELATADTDLHSKEIWQDFRRPGHDFPWSIFVQGKPQMSDEDTNRMLALIASIGRSVECLGAGTWTGPMQFIQEPLAKELVATAELICTNPINRRGIEIWLRLAKTMKPNASTKHILEKYSLALEAEGLLDEAASVAGLREHVPAAHRARQPGGR